MDIEQFIAARTPVWQDLDALLARAEDDPAGLSHDEVHRLIELYRRTASDLNLVRSYTANAELIGSLNQLAGRAYRFVYQAGHEKPVRSALVRLLTREIPAAFRRERVAIALAAAAFIFGTLFGSGAVLVDRANAQRLVPPEFFSESPRERVEHIEKDDERVDSAEKALLFGASLYTHNIQVSFLAFSLGALTIVGGFWLLFYNGVLLGAIATLYVLDGVTTFFVAWVGPHGALELPSIIFAAGAGLLAGRALLMPGNLTRAASLRRVLPSVWRIMIGTCLTLVFAGLIEGGFSQYSAKSIPYAFKISVAAILFLGLMSYLFVRRLGEE